LSEGGGRLETAPGALHGRLAHVTAKRPELRRRDRNRNPKGRNGWPNPSVPLGRFGTTRRTTSTMPCSRNRGRETAEERRCAQMNSEVKSSLRSLRSLRLRKNRARATGSEPQVAEPSSIFTARNARSSKIPGVHANARRHELANPLAQKNAPLPRSQRKTSKRSINELTFGTAPLRSSSTRASQAPL
jgi:hypothetical protein